jgi:cell division protein FtsW (lipid II flippase)
MNNFIQIAVYVVLIIFLVYEVFYKPIKVNEQTRKYITKGVYTLLAIQLVLKIIYLLDK